MLRMSSVTVLVLLSNYLTALLIGPAENCRISFSVRLLIQKLLWASDECLKIASCVAPQTRYLHSIQIWRVVPFQAFVDSYREGIVDTRAMCTELHASRLIYCSFRQQSVALFNELWEQKLINNTNYCLQQH